MDLDNAFFTNLMAAEEDANFDLDLRELPELEFDFIDFTLPSPENEETDGSAQNNTGNSLNQSNTTDSCHDVIPYRVTTADPIETYDRDQDLQQVNRPDATWINFIKSLRKNEKLRIRRHAPRLETIDTNPDNVLHINSTLRLLLNAPVIIQLLFSLRDDAYSQSMTDATVQANQNLFDILRKIIQMAYVPDQNEHTAVNLVQLFGKNYTGLYPGVNDWIKQDPADFYWNFINLLIAMLIDRDTKERFFKALAIKMPTTAGNDQSQIIEARVLISSDINNFVEYINDQYSYILGPDHSGNMTIPYMSRPLPEQIVLVDVRPEKSSPIPYPAEFHTRHDQHYLLTGAVIPDATCPNAGNYLAMICRQDSVYLINTNRLIDRFHPLTSNYHTMNNSIFSVYPRLAFYTQVDPLHEKICAFEDPMAGTIAGKPSRALLGHSSTENSVTSTQFKSSMPPIDELPMNIQNPILSTFRYYMDTDFDRKNIIVTVPELKDCLEQIGLYLKPRKMFKDAFIEATLVFQAPNGQYYRSHYRFVHRLNPKPKFKNPTYISVKQDDNEEWFPFTAKISKAKLDFFQSKRKKSEDTCQIVSYPDREIKIVDRENVHLLIQKPEDKKPEEKKRKNNMLRKSDEKITPSKLSKFGNINTIYLALRRVRKVGKNKYVPDSKVLFLSNPFRPVSSTVKKENYDYRCNELKIEPVSKKPTMDTNNPGMICSLSYSIPKETYRCTALNDKHIQVTIHTSNDEESIVHPLYRIWNGQNYANQLLIPATKYSSTLDLQIIRRSPDELENSTDSSTVQGVPNAQSISNDSTLKSFFIQLQLGHGPEEKFQAYPHSTVKSEMIIDDMSEEQQILSSALVTDIIESNDTPIEQTSIYPKRAHADEDDVLANSAPKFMKQN